MRGLGKNPTESDLEELLEEVDEDQSGSIDYGEFVLIMSKKTREVETEDEVLEAFRVFDSDGSGFMTPDEFRSVLTSLGETLTDDQVDELLEDAELDENGKINYEEFSKVLMRRS
eukprot:CAMPEP_0117428656 /NCGR_PEP_ID=MMETSP0758-20121206/8311_1 /TAXON_ID=63605 /ORGANISM="Percolomonas cosmopolitus, Strain AE-1 (ATCC 50343)" /LENGTH=114 /DNA_ID=CAMNT_0005215125 /DNA_START=98 /DNA_END=442 /DNA_ORIENTATION=+